jgi:peptidoglycan/LPS O-acetylase OafA/YrhL
MDAPAIRRHALAEPVASQAQPVGVLTPRRAPYASLNVVRVVLAFLVLGYHAGGTIALDKYFSMSDFDHLLGFAGNRVAFFFVLSGFVMKLAYGKYIGQFDKCRPYFWRRFVRVFPTYWVVLLMVIVASMFLPNGMAAVPGDVWSILKMLLLIPQSHGAGGPHGAPLLIVAWTMHYEIVFYVVLGAWIASRVLGATISLLLVVNAADCASGGCGPYREFLSGLPMAYFVVGVAAAWAVRRLPALPAAMPIMWLALAGYVLIALAPQLSDGQWVWPHSGLLSVGLAGVMLVCLVNAEEARAQRSPSAWVQRLSDASYAMYLLHFPIISLVCKLLMLAGLQGVVGATLALVLSFVVSIAAALAFNVYIERRLVAWLK